MALLLSAAVLLGACSSDDSASAGCTQREIAGPIPTNTMFGQINTEPVAVVTVAPEFRGEIADVSAAVTGVAFVGVALDDTSGQLLITSPTELSGERLRALFDLAQRDDRIASIDGIICSEA